ncbi:indole-3-glycerol phosphate synthase [Thermostichus sp. MS-CIW-19]|jgi:indole-3-glycerol phosphate synthase|uniref:indole-3-glycerol phosphate synthase TrpC n=1 Tax=unclassified Synechococcus TaxID=2626047 RepID=UPI0000694775|nr:MULTISPECIES: indole-3-glycerol phosphate synthase TrpC [unclassified Synechococcus]ABD00495.1 indole-3-glycerol phosphate synthase [Synechococcus sp. JA-3-3Ab]PIK86665.1 indole-3-glycerol-phosphate synthase [Synechococcus sp. 63AY4M2]PIK92021.1 indole-3-glycerol-phosphate synthase [Synechococcus sp. 65AY6Li]
MELEGELLAVRRRSPAPPVVVASQVYRTKAPEAEPRHILEEIVWHKEQEVERQREQLPLKQLQQQLEQAPPVRDFVAALTQSPHPVSLIAEVKKASPSRGVLRDPFDPVAIAQSYEAAGASCLSVLTDERFFQGSGEYLRQIRQAVGIPILCKEFILYPYQILWARTLGADAVLLIAAILSDADLGYFLKLIQQLGMAALLEVHTCQELQRVLALPHLQQAKGRVLIGINNRDLKTFAVDLNTTRDLLVAHRERLGDLPVVSESGIHTPADLQQLRSWGVRAVLVGEALVTQPDPGQAVRSLLSSQ